MSEQQGSAGSVGHGSSAVGVDPDSTTVLDVPAPEQGADATRTPEQGADATRTPEFAAASAAQASAGSTGRVGAGPTAAQPNRVEPPRPDPRRPGRAEQRASVRPPVRRRARLGLRRVDPLSVFVLTLIISLFLGVVLVAAVGVLYSVTSSLGVVDSLQTLARDLKLINDNQQLLNPTRVFGAAAIVAAANVVLLSVLATLGAVLYNICAVFTGGIEVTLAERD